MSNENPDQQTPANGATTPPFSVPPAEAVAPRKADIVGPKQPIVLDETEKMRAENIALRAENLGYRKQNIQGIIAELNKEEMALKEESAKMRTELAHKYGLDSSRMKLRADGTLVEDLPVSGGTVRTGSRP